MAETMFMGAVGDVYGAGRSAQGAARVAHAVNNLANYHPGRMVGVILGPATLWLWVTVWFIGHIAYIVTELLPVGGKVRASGWCPFGVVLPLVCREEVTEYWSFGVRVVASAGFRAVGTMGCVCSFCGLLNNVRVETLRRQCLAVALLVWVGLWWTRIESVRAVLVVVDVLVGRLLVDVMSLGTTDVEMMLMALIAGWFKAPMVVFAALWCVFKLASDHEIASDGAEVVPCVRALFGDVVLSHRQVVLIDSYLAEKAGGAGWSQLDFDALLGDRVLNYLAAVEAKRWGVAKADVACVLRLYSNQLLATALARVHPEWFKVMPESMHAKPAATVVEALVSVVIGQYGLSSVQAKLAFGHFTSVLAEMDGGEYVDGKFVKVVGKKEE